MKPKSLSLITAMIALLVPSTGRSEVITQIEMPLATTITVPCAARGAGEMIDLTGEVHAVFSVTVDANGGVHISTHFNNVGVSGIGLTTGDRYHAAGPNHFVSNSRGTQNELTFVNDFLLVAPGSGNNLRIHELVHVTVDANGEITAEVNSLAVDCG
jgi:hypothetical protein